MISFVQPLAAGNAIRLHLAPPEGALEWRVLRRPTDDFAGPDDAGAERVAPGAGPRPGAVLDAGAELVNGFTYAYRFYSRDAAGWTSAPAVAATPRATFTGDGPDAQDLLRERIALGLKSEIARGRLRPRAGKIDVITTPAGVPDEKSLPIVCVHLDSDLPAHRFLGEHMEAETPTGIGFDASEDDAEESAGQFTRVALSVVAVSVNGDERAALRKAIKRIVAANWPVFDEAGLLLPEFAQRDDEEKGQNNAVLFRSEGAFTCLAPAVVSWPVSIVTDVTVTATTVSPKDPETDG